MQSSENKQFTDVRKCEHCQNFVPMPIEWKGENSFEENDEYGNFLGWYEHWEYRLLVCPACKKPIISCIYKDAAIPDPETSTVFPSPSKGVRGLPPEVKQAFDSAQKVKHDPNAYAVLIGRVLDFVCKDRNAGGKSLFDRLNDLAERGEIPIKLVEVAHSLRDLRNIGAHADLGTLTYREVPLLDDLSRAILEYVYSAPSLVRAVEKQLEQLKK